MTNNTNNHTNTFYATTHLHSEFSQHDSTLSLNRIFEHAKKMGATAVAVTDHGNLMSVEPAKEASKKYGVRYIPGTEAYYEDTNAEVDKRMHLILLAKDIEGYNAISLAVTKSNSNIDNQNFPRMNDEILKECFGPNSKGYGHVIATSACVSGVIASVLLMNDTVHNNISKLVKRKLSLHDPSSPIFLSACKKLEAIKEELKEISETIPVLNKLSKTPFVRKEKVLKTFEGTPEYPQKKAELDAEKTRCAEAGKKVEELKEKRATLKLEESRLSEGIKPVLKDIDKIAIIDEKIAILEKELLSEEELYQNALNQAKKFANIFGKNNFYCELQYHGMPEEAKVMPIIAKIATELHLPIIAANDAHMISNSKDEQKARQIIRSLRFNKWEQASEWDKEVYMKSDEELTESLQKILPLEIVEEAMENIKKVADSCYVEFVSELHYPKFRSKDGFEDATARLRRLSREGIAWRYPDISKWTPQHEERLEYELEVITKLGFCDYLCIVEDFLRYGRLLGKIDITDERYLSDPYNMELLKELAKDKVGLGIGPGRGSAVGSLVSYLIGITGIDPMEYGLIFERFLNVERVSMPDIDSDFKTDIRDKVIDYVKHIYGEEAVCCIMTRGTQAAKASIRNTARLLGSEKYDDSSHFLSLGDAISKKIPTEVGIKLEDCKEKLFKEFGDNPDAIEIINNAMLIEGTFANVGMHAAGVIIADNGDVKQYLPLMWNDEKGQWTTQCEKDYCEANGLLKMDFLGLRNLNIITETLLRVKENTGKSIDIEKVPFEKNVFSNIFATGKTNSIFQFESGGMKKMLRQFQPTCIEDIILLVAAYRPGPMQYLDSIIAVKHGKQKPEYVIPEMETILGQTYGYPVYQEQIMQIFNKFAGFSLGESDIIRRYMSKKKTEKFAAYKDKFIAGIVSRGANPVKAEEFWTQLVEFSKYAFNKSHATAYAIVAYYTAYLKYHYPAEYLCSVMNDTKFEKLNGLINDCKTFGIPVYPADINYSDEKFSTKKDGILAGLSLVKAVGNSAENLILNRQTEGSFKSFGDFMLRTSCKKNVAENLIYAGAFDAFSKNRQALVDVVPSYVELLKKIKDKQKIIDAEYDETDNKQVAKVERAQKSLNTLIANLHSIAINSYGEEDYLVRLANEKDKVGAFVSGHPLDTYGQPADFHCTPVSDVEPIKEVSVMGIITNLRIVQRKKDGANLAFFTLEDQTGMIEINCFTSTYADFKDLIVEDTAVIISGNCFEEIDSITEETVLKINAKSLKKLNMKKDRIIIEIASPMEWNDIIYGKIKPYRDNNGLELVVFDKMNGLFRNTDILINSAILEVEGVNSRKE